MITCLALSPSLDVTYRVDSLRAGEISRPTEIHKVAGGKGLNVARSVARLGAPVRAVAVLGGHTGAHVAALLTGSGVELDAVRVEGETRTCVSIAAADDERLTEVYERAAPIEHVAFAEVLARLAALGEGDWVVLSGSVPPGISPEQVSSLLRDAAASGARIAVDTHGPALAAVIDDRPDLIKVNRAEAAEVLGMPTAAGMELARALQARTGGIAVVTDGVDGSAAVGESGDIRIPGDPVRGRFPVGSGDSYTAGLVVALARGHGLVDAVLLGAACATANAAQPGAGEWSLDDLEVARARITAHTSNSGHP